MNQTVNFTENQIFAIDALASRFAGVAKKIDNQDELIKNAISDVITSEELQQFNYLVSLAQFATLGTTDKFYELLLDTNPINANIKIEVSQCLTAVTAENGDIFDCEKGFTPETLKALAKSIWDDMEYTEEYVSYICNL